MTDEQRYLVKIEDIDGSWDILTVWAATPEAAVNLATDWIDYTDRRPLFDRPHQVEVLGHQSDPTDLGIAQQHGDVNHVRVAADGRPLDTRYRRASDIHPGHIDGSG